MDDTSRGGPLIILVDGETVPLSWLLGQLRTCSDAMPRGTCDELDLPVGSSYASGAARLIDRLAER